MEPKPVAQRGKESLTKKLLAEAARVKKTNPSMENTPKLPPGGSNDNV